MPRVSDAHKAARHSQVLNAARACFARRGYQATTIRDLERETGMSSGAIFNYFDTKLDIFVALAEEDTAHTARLWSAGGLRAIVEHHTGAQPAYTASYLEVGRQLLTDPDFRARWARRGDLIVEAIRNHLRTQQEQGLVRTDLPLDDLVTYSAIHLDGITLQMRLGTTPTQLVTAVDLYEQALRPPPTSPPA
ncbi:MAG: TetR/AcrR family transcriptional regulator [Micrococcales bacterium]|nr:TetR/AcrR family transcriptional regulator [Micrococcales bacterium]